LTCYLDDIPIRVWRCDIHGVKNVTFYRPMCALDYGSVTRRKKSGPGCSVRSDTSVFSVFYKVEYNHIKQHVNCCVHMCLFQISSSMFVSRISKIGWNMTKISQKVTFLRHSVLLPKGGGVVIHVWQVRHKNIGRSKIAQNVTCFLTMTFVSRTFVVFFWDSHRAMKWSGSKYYWVDSRILNVFKNSLKRNRKILFNFRLLGRNNHTSTYVVWY